jgi:hypothetical protein
MTEILGSIVTEKATIGVIATDLALESILEINTVLIFTSITKKSFRQDTALLA